ncbi:MAG TPA: DUF1684 domain-containing protein [Spirochaetia bacterium]|nr:DUF1684 domain-containing protein [Spirochaetia bacterium]
MPSRGCVISRKKQELRIEVAAEEFPDKQTVTMQTTTGEVQEHLRWGRFRFTVVGKQVYPTIYQSGDGFFAPFADSLAGKETYRTGRYLEPHRRGDGVSHIDFNYAYNSYRACNERWSCPIPPAENRLAVPVRAGEKLFDTHQVAGRPAIDQASKRLRKNSTISRMCVGMEASASHMGNPGVQRPVHT